MQRSVWEMQQCSALDSRNERATYLALPRCFRIKMLPRTKVPEGTGILFAQPDRMLGWAIGQACQARGNITFVASYYRNPESEPSHWHQQLISPCTIARIGKEFTLYRDEDRLLKRWSRTFHIYLPDKRCCILDGPSHDTVQMLTSRAHHNLAPC